MDAKAVMTLFTRLLLLDPGTIQSHPELGVGLTSKYRYSLEGAEITLQSDIRQQIDKYLPKFQGAEVMVKMIDHSFRIAITFNNHVFAFLYDIEENVLTNTFSRLADL